MKKISILVAAIAMIAFAGCNKEKENQGFTPDENGMVSLNLAGESYGPVAKQAYYAYDQYILFEMGDQCYANGVLANIALIDPATNEVMTGDATATSNVGRITVPAAAATLPFTVLYPAGSYIAGVEADYPGWTVPMNNKVYLIAENAQEGVTISTEYSEVTPNWPMAAQLTDFHGIYQLKHAVAIGTPQFLFGTTYLNRLATAYPTDITFTDPSTVSLIVDSIILTSYNSMMTGNGHVDFTNPNEPILVMDGTVSADGDILTIYPTPSVLNSYTPGTGNNPTTNNIGNFTLAPMHGADVTNGIPADEIQMTAYFTLDDGSNYYHCVYNGDPAEISNRVNNGSILRGRRTYLAIDLYTAGGAQKTTLLYVD